MKLKIDQLIEKTDFHPKRCYFGLDEIDFAQNYGWSTEFVGYLKPSLMDEEHIFLFYLEKVIRENQIGSLHVLDPDNEEEYTMILRALMTDYNIKKENITLL